MTRRRISHWPSTVLAASLSLGLVSVAISVFGQARRPARTDEATRDEIRRRLEYPDLRSTPILGERLFALGVLPAFYETRMYLPAWTEGAGPTESALEMASILRLASRDGLVADHYHRRAIDDLLARSARRLDPAVSADLDLLLTDAFLILGAHLVSGRVDPESLDPMWIASRREVDLAPLLSEAVRRGDPAGVLEQLRPRHAGYARLRDALDRYRVIVERGGWPKVAGGEALRPADTDERVPALRARLGIVESQRGSAEQDTLYDSELEVAVRRFQARHGLAEDGVVGEKTLAALNVPAAERMRQIELNLERWRWLPLELGDAYVLVNIPDFSLTAVESGRPVLTMKVAVGRSYRRTPVFSDRMRYLVVNPFWEVPHKLAVQDKLPEIKKDPSYLSRLGFRVLQGWGAEEKEVAPETVDWAALGPARFPYRLRQSPGPLNALGRIKFMFPNRFNVYLHDTPDRKIFLKSDRDVSSGCIRLERPFDLADFLLSASSKWNRAALDTAVAAGREVVVSEVRPVAVHLLYWTAWAEEDGSVQFRRDVYGRDALLDEALARLSTSS